VAPEIERLGGPLPTPALGRLTLLIQINNNTICDGILVEPEPAQLVQHVAGAATGMAVNDQPALPVTQRQAGAR
jgi:hypothetical protein